LMQCADESVTEYTLPNLALSIALFERPGTLHY